MNQEVPARIVDANGQQIGVGFQENNNFQYNRDIPLALAGVQTTFDDKLLPNQSKQTVYLVLGVYTALFVILLICVVFAMKAL